MGLFNKSKKSINEDGAKNIDQDNIIESEIEQMVIDMVDEPLIAPDPPKGGVPANLKKLLKNAIPSKRGLYPHELLMLYHSHKYKTEENKFPGYWYYSHGIKNPQLILNSLYERGFIEVGDVYKTVENLKTDVIRQELKEHNLKVSGKKADLVNRLIESVDDDTLSKKFPERYYKLTSRGELELEENNYIKYYAEQGCYGLSIWDLNRLIAKGKRSVEQIVENFLNKQWMLHAKRYDFRFYRSARLDLCEFLIRSKRYSEAMDICVENIYSSLSFLTNDMKGQFTSDQSNKLYYLPGVFHLTPYMWSRFQPSGTWYLKKLTKEMNISNEEIKKILEDSYSNIHIPRMYQLFTKEECVNIVLAEWNEDMDYLENMYASVEKRKKEELKLLETDETLLQTYVSELRDFSIKQIQIGANNEVDSKFDKKKDVNK